MKRFTGITLVIIGAILIFWAYQNQQAQLSLQKEDINFYITGIIALLVGGFSIWKSK